MSQQKSIKVLMLVPSLRIGSGVASFAISYFRKLDHQVIQMDFACYYKKPESYAEEIVDFGSKVFYLPPVKHFFKHYSDCKKILRNGNYDIIHNCSLINTIPMMFVAKRLIPIRIIHGHSSRLGETKFKAIRNAIFLPFLRSSANYYVACSDLAAKAIFGNRKYTFIPNVIDSKSFAFCEDTRQKIRNEMNVGNKIIIGSIGRAASPKNPFRALRIIKSVLGKNHNVEYWWAGNGPLMDKMQSYAKKLGIENQVSFLGNRNDVPDLYQAMDIFFMPSKFEGLPISCIEAQATGLPCILSDVITKNVAYTELVEYLSLSESDSCWAEHILRIANKRTIRHGYMNELNKSLFNNEEAGERLKQYYLSLCQ